MNKRKSKMILDNHTLWIKSGGEEGKKADLSDECLYGANLSGLDLRFADLSGVNLEEAALKNINLMGADLSDSDLSGADFSDADLSGANLGGADFSGANLKYANLEGANLSGANLKGADLKGASLDFAAFPLWCGGVDVNIDEDQAIQLLYHLLKNIEYSKNVGVNLKRLLLKKEIVDIANKFYMAKECGKIEGIKKPEQE